MPPRVIVFASALLVFAASGCTAVNSTARRSLVTAAGTAVGGGVGYALGDHDPLVTLGGAAAGTLLTQLAQGEDRDVRQAGFDQGYVHGQSDAIKRQYFLRQAMEEQPLPAKANEGAAVYYVVPGPEVTPDGRKLAPHDVVVKVVE